MSFDPRRVAARAAARKQADEVFELLEWPDNYGADFAEAFIDRLREHLPKRRQPTPAPPVPYARLASTCMPFGGHHGKTFRDVPDDYLDWLCREQEEFLRLLQAYLKHPEHRPTNPAA